MINGVDERVEDILRCKIKTRYSDIDLCDISDVDIITASKINPIIVTSGKSGYYAVANIRLLSLAKIKLKKSTMINCIVLDDEEDVRRYAVAGEFILMLLHTRTKKEREVKKIKNLLDSKVKMNRLAYAKIQLVKEIAKIEYRYNDYGDLTEQACRLINKIAVPCMRESEDGYQVVANIPSSRCLGGDDTIMRVNDDDTEIIMRVDSLITSKLHETSLNAQVYIAEMMKVMPGNEIANMFKSKMTKSLIAERMGYRRESMFSRVVRTRLIENEVGAKNDLAEYNISIEGRSDDTENNAD